AMLFGVFGVSVLHNIIHLVFGLVGIFASRTFNGARGFLVGSGMVYAVLYVYGSLVERHSGANVVPVNTADNWLHLGLALGLLFFGWAFGRTGTNRPLGDLSTGFTVNKG